MSEPSVGLVVPSRDRPASLGVVLRALAEQRYPGDLEIVVIDDSEVVPDVANYVIDRPVQLLPVARGTNLGTKMNLGVQALATDLVMKIDDDDWYGPNLVARMVTGLGSFDAGVIQPFRMFDLASWQLRWADAGRCAGSGMIFRRASLAAVPFRDRRDQIDGWILADLLDASATIATIDVSNDFAYVRRPWSDHLWQALPDGTPFTDYFETLAGSDLGPESLLPSWALDTYLEMRQQAIR